MISELRSIRTMGVLVAATFMLASPVVRAEDITVRSTTTIFACGQLFDIQSNAAGLTAAQRAAIVQRNLDNALIAAKDREPSAVQVVMMNRNPIVALDGFYIVTADGNSAARAGITQIELANKWANSMRECLADKIAVNKYLSMLTGNFPKGTARATTGSREDIAIAPIGMDFPVQLGLSLHARKAKLGDSIEAVLRTDVPFGPDFTTYLPAGTKAIGELVYAKNFVPNQYGGKRALTPHFYSLRTPDNKDIPIDGYIVGDINLWKNVKTEPSNTACVEGTESFHKAMEAANLPDVAVAGKMVGAWRGPADYSDTLGFVGEPGYRTNNLQYNGLIVPAHSRAVIPAGSQMLLRLGSTTSVAINSPGRELVM
jgi:hypothetical protein